MQKKSVFEKIMLLILFLLASPFIIAIFTLFLVIYIAVSPIELLIYRKSNYYKDLKEKYYLFITRNKNYLLYNELRKDAIAIKITIDNLEYNAYKSKDKLLIYTKGNVEFNNNTLLVSGNNVNGRLSLEDLDSFYVIKRDTFTKIDDYKLAKTIKNIIIYE